MNDYISKELAEQISLFMKRPDFIIFTIGEKLIEIREILETHHRNRVAIQKYAVIFDGIIASPLLEEPEQVFNFINEKLNK